MGVVVVDDQGQRLRVQGFKLLGLTASGFRFRVVGFTSGFPALRSLGLVFRSLTSPAGPKIKDQCDRLELSNPLSTPDYPPG